MGKVGFVVVGVCTPAPDGGYHGYVTVDHAKISRKFTQVGGCEQGREGRLEGRAGPVRQAMKVISSTVASGGGFGAGVLLGLRSG